VFSSRPPASLHFRLSSRQLIASALFFLPSRPYDLGETARILELATVREGLRLNCWTISFLPSAFRYTETIINDAACFSSSLRSSVSDCCYVDSGPKVSTTSTKRRRTTSRLARALPLAFPLPLGGLSFPLAMTKTDLLLHICGNRSLNGSSPLYKEYVSMPSSLSFRRPSSKLTSTIFLPSTFQSHRFRRG